MTTNSHPSKRPMLAYPIVVMCLAACFLFYKYILQVFPSIMTHSLMVQFDLSGAGLGGLVACFYYSYLVMQLFVGVLLDKYSTRWLTAFAISIAALAVLLFAYAQTVFEAGFYRALMGIGVAFATVSYMKLAAIWFPPRHYAFVSGLLATAAMAGAVFGQAPLAWFINDFGWRSCLSMTGIIGLGLALLFLCIVRDGPAKKTATASPIAWQDLLMVFRNKQNWLLTLYSGLAFSPVAVFGGLWGNPFLEEAYHLTKTEAAGMVSLIFIGLGLGSPVLGKLSDYLQNRRHVMFFSTLLSCLAITAVLYAQFLPLTIVKIALFLFGFGLGAFMLVFAIGKELNPLQLTATVIAMINTSDAALDAFTEPFIGKLLDLSWDGQWIDGVHHFSVSNYHMALAVLPLYLLVAVFLLLWIKDK